MTYSNMIKASTLDLGSGVVDHYDDGSPHQHWFVGTAAFDWQIPDSGLRFNDCQYFSITTADRGDPHIVHVFISAAPAKLPWPSLKRAVYHVRDQLVADGWKPAFYKGEGDANDVLTNMLEKPTPNDFDTSVGAVTFGKGSTALSIDVRRVHRPEPGQKFYDGTDFIYIIEQDRRAEWNVTYGFDGTVRLP